MADHFCWPLWTPLDQGPGNLDPASLPLSDQLVRELLLWAARWDAILDMDYPPDSGFASAEEEDRFNADGRALATRLARELGGAYEVTFHNTHGRKVIIDASRPLTKSTPENRRPSIAGLVRSIDEVEGLRRMNATGVSFLLAPHPIFPSDRVSSLANAQRICEQLPGRHGIMLPPEMTSEDLSRLVASIPVEFVEIDVRRPPERQVIELARRSGFELLASGLDVDHDHDPDWLRKRLDDAAREFRPDLFVVTLVPCLKDPHHWFTEDAGEYEDDLTQEQVDAVLREHPVLVNMELNEHPPEVLCELFPAARGSYVYIGEPREDGGTPAFSLLPA